MPNFHGLTIRHKFYLTFFLAIYRTFEIQLNGGTPFDTGVDLDPSVSLKGNEVFPCYPINLMLTEKLNQRNTTRHDTTRHDTTRTIPRNAPRHCTA